MIVNHVLAHKAAWAAAGASRPLVDRNRPLSARFIRYACSVEGRLSQHIADPQSWQRELVFMPQMYGPAAFPN